MRKIKRDYYLNKLIKKQNNGLIKIITGIRRCGKSYLLDPLFKEYLISSGIAKDHIIKLELDDRKNKKYLDPDILDEYIRSRIKDNKKYYVLLDEIQLVDDFVSVLNTFTYMDNVEVYVTGSNAKLLSKDIITEFRGRGDVIELHPLSFSEFVTAFNGSKEQAWNEYFLYGGLPLILTLETDDEKSEYLKRLFNEVYINDIIERHNINNIDEMNELINMLSSSIGSLTNPSRLENTFKSKKKVSLSDKTISSYIEYLIDAFLIKKAERYNIKGKKNIGAPFKYYFEDIGLRNARLNFRQLDDGHIIENIIYNELIKRGYNVDVGVVELNEKDEHGINKKPQYEVDFVVNKGNQKYYIQSAFQIPDHEKYLQETKSLNNINDSFRKIIIVKDDIKLRRDENGIIMISIFNFLLNENSLDM